MEREIQEQDKLPADQSAFSSFLLQEYDNIAKAHYNTVESISAFFKNYIIIMSLPVTASVLLFRLGNASDIANWLLYHTETYLILGAVPMIVGFLILGYVINLRCDALLYARAVNGIRRYFSERSSYDERTLPQYLILPRETTIPRYFEWSYFLFVILTFAFIGTGYLLGGMYLYWDANVLSRGFYFFAFPIIAFLAHIGLYCILTHHREGSYLRSQPK